MDAIINFLSEFPVYSYCYREGVEEEDVEIFRVDVENGKVIINNHLTIEPEEISCYYTSGSDGNVNMITVSRHKGGKPILIIRKELENEVC